MPGVYLSPRAVNVEVFEYHNTVIIGDLLLILFILSLYRGYKTRRRNWYVAACLLGAAGLGLLLLNFYLLGVPIIG